MRPQGTETADTEQTGAEIQGKSHPQGALPAREVELDPVLLRKNRIMSFFCEESAADGIKILRTRIMDRVEEARVRSILVTSARRGEGRTLTAANLAVSVSQLPGQPSLLVDSDLKRPGVAALFGVEASLGLDDFLLRQAEIDDILVNVGIPKLTLMPASKAIQASAELLSSRRMESLVGELTERLENGVVVFDSPPLLESADALVLSRYVDAVLFVVEAEKVPFKDVAECMDLLKEKNLLGMVLNKARE